MMGGKTLLCFVCVFKESCLKCQRSTLLSHVNLVDNLTATKWNMALKLTTLMEFLWCFNASGKNSANDITLFKLFATRATHGML